MLNLIKQHQNSRKIIKDGYSLLMVSHVNELQQESLEYLDGLIIDTDNVTHAKEIVLLVRTHDEVQTSLLPIFINNIYKLPQEIYLHTDGAIELTLLSSYMQKVITINKRIQKIVAPKLVSLDVLIQFKTLSYCYTRNTGIIPKASRKSYIGYEFPFISLFYKETEVISLLQSLDKARQLNYLSFQLEDYVHLCKSCSGNYLNFRECCPKCDSIDIKAHDMIHHFVCAHVAPEKDFRKEEGLECPKCDKHLRHIGIDYDKPSTIYSCNGCNHEFQNAGMKALCLDCETENELDELLEKSIGNYQITQKGEQLLFQTNKISTSGNVSSINKVGLNPSLFKIIVSQEIKRVKLTKGNSVFVSIEFFNDQLQMLNEEVKKALKKEIGDIIKSYLKNADILSAERFNKYYLLLPETKENQLERLENIQYNLSKLLSDNLEDTKQEIKINTHKILGTDQAHQYFS
ncbi:MAG: hypothetical protein JXQ93_08735 [Flavobacteriaceae bacterium]